MVVGDLKTAAQLQRELQEQKADEAKRLDLIKAQTEAAKEQATATAAATASAGKSAAGEAAKTTDDIDKINLSEVIDQTMAGTAPMLPVSKINELHKNYEDRLKGECPEDEAPSDQQLSCLLYVVLIKLLNPFVDLAIWGPHQVRVARKLILSGMVPTGFGTFR